MIKALLSFSGKPKHAHTWILSMEAVWMGLLKIVLSNSCMLLALLRGVCVLLLLKWMSEWINGYNGLGWNNGSNQIISINYHTLCVCVCFYVWMAKNGFRTNHTGIGPFNHTHLRYGGGRAIELSEWNGNASICYQVFQFKQQSAFAAHRTSLSVCGFCIRIRKWIERECKCVWVSEWGKLDWYCCHFVNSM